MQWGHSWCGHRAWEVLCWHEHSSLGKGLALRGAGKQGKAEVGSGSAVSPLHHSELGSRQPFGSQGLAVQGRKQQQRILLRSSLVWKVSCCLLCTQLLLS